MTGALESTAGNTVLLLGGSIGEGYDISQRDKDFPNMSSDEYDIRVEEAIISVVRGVLIRRGRLAFLDDAVVTPLAIEVATEYWQSLPGEERRNSSEERKFEDVRLLIVGPQSLVPDREELDYAIRIGCARLISAEELGQLDVSRAVCIGGTRNTEEMLDRLRSNWQSFVPVHAIPSTGGAAKDLVESDQARDAEGRAAEVVVSRRANLHFKAPELEAFSSEAETGSRPFGIPEQERQQIPDFRYALYPLIVSLLLDSA